MSDTRSVVAKIELTRVDNSYDLKIIGFIAGPIADPDIMRLRDAFQAILMLYLGKP